MTTTQHATTTSTELLRQWLAYADGLIDPRQLQRLIKRTRHHVRQA